MTSAPQTPSYGEITQSVPDLEHSDTIENYENVSPQFSPSYQFANGITGALQQGALHNILYATKVAYHQATTNIDPLTSDERAGLQKQYPNFTYPNGIDKDEAQWITQDGLDMEDYKLVANHATGFWGNLAARGGRFVGNALEPVSLVAGAALTTATLPEDLLVGGAAATTLTGLAAFRAAQGAVFSFGASTVEEASEALKDKITGQDYNAVEGLANIGANTVMGGLLFGGGAFGWHGLTRTLADKLGEPFIEAPVATVNAASKAYSDFATVGSNSDNATIRTAAKKIQYWNNEFPGNDSRKLPLMDNLLNATQDEVTAQGKNTSPEITKALNNVLAAHANLMTVHNGIVADLPVGEQTHEKVANILRTATTIAPEDDAAIQRIAISQMQQGKDIDVEIPVKQAVYEQSQALRQRFIDAKLDPDLVADTADETRQNILSEIDKTASDINDVKTQLKNNPDDEELVLKHENLRNKLALLQEQEGTHEFLSSSLRGTVEPPSGEEVKAYVERMKGTQDDLIGANEDLGLGEEEESKTFDEAEKEANQLNPDDLKREGNEFEVYNKSIEAGKEDVAKINRRLSKWPKLIRSAIDCVRGLV